MNVLLRFDDAAFDDLIASLMIHYLEGCAPVLAEVRRILRPAGRLFTYVDHPIVAYTSQKQRPGYFAPTSYRLECEGSV
ncbi:class I SAM-dependent methyltransferase [Paramicrobacterium chengjingii]|uniref:class I SAM-dependent methyltransferase n=1 Tax=Paramicrobacterium chengjingii TaxID=2769067 RepID=UPI001422A937|nr:methyltransferase domain-containing protein [Microbacterium chengjingii]